MDSPTSPPVGAAAYIFQNWTIIVLIMIALFAVLVIAGMIWGQKKARERHRAEEAAEERAEEAGAELPPASPQPPLDAAGGLPADEPEPEPAPSPEPVAEPEPTPPPAPPAPIAARELAPEPVPERAVEPEPAVTPQADPEPPAAELPIMEPAAPEPVAEPEKPAPAAPAVDPEIARALALTTIKGLGPKVAAMLAERGFTRVDQLAALSAEDASALDIQLGAFTGRMTRDRWIEQAKLLAAGDTAAYEAVFGKLG